MPITRRDAVIRYCLGVFMGLLLVMRAPAGISTALVLPHHSTRDRFRQGKGVMVAPLPPTVKREEFGHEQA